MFRMRKYIVEKKIKCRGKIIWVRIQGDMVTTLSNKISLLGFPRQSEDANEMWMNNSKSGRRDLRGVVGKTKSV